MPTLLTILCLMLCLPYMACAALPANEIWREALLNDRVGYGRNATGGAGGTLCQVTNLTNSGAGSLRACTETVGTFWITFTVSGVITLSTDIHLQSNKTIDGRAADITISGAGLVVGVYHDVGNNPTTNVIIENLKFEDANVTTAMINITETANNIWVDHCTFHDAIDERLHVGSDGSDSATRAAPTNITLSWNKSLAPTAGQGWDDKTLLISDPTLPVDAGARVTMHHNHYGTFGRHPLARYAQMHAFNNYYDKGELGAQIRSHGRFYSENEVFEAPYAGAYPRVQCNGEPPESEVAADNCLITGQFSVRGDETYQSVNPGTIFNPAADYAYTPATANTALRTAIIAGAGWQNVTAPTSSPAAVILRVIQ